MVDALAPFDDDRIAAVAEEHGMDEPRLRTVLEAHQELFRGFGERSVADMIYEWRTGLPGDPLVAQTETVAYLDAPEHAWTDLIARMDASETVAAAIRTVHARQFEADRGEAITGALVVAQD